MTLVPAIWLDAQPEYGGPAESAAKECAQVSSWTGACQPCVTEFTKHPGQVLKDAAQPADSLDPKVPRSI